MSTDTADLGTLTEEEVRLIKSRREKAERLRALTALCSKQLKTASEYFDWLDREGRGTSFSAFVNEFDYQDDDSEIMYQAVKRIFEVLE